MQNQRLAPSYGSLRQEPLLNQIVLILAASSVCALQGANG